MTPYPTDEKKHVVELFWYGVLLEVLSCERTRPTQAMGRACDDVRQLFANAALSSCKKLDTVSIFYVVDETELSNVKALKIRNVKTRGRCLFANVNMPAWTLESTGESEFDEIAYMVVLVGLFAASESLGLPSQAFRERMKEVARTPRVVNLFTSYLA